MGLPPVVLLTESRRRPTGSKACPSRGTGLRKRRSRFRLISVRSWPSTPKLPSISRVHQRAYMSRSLARMQSGPLLIWAFEATRALGRLVLLEFSATSGDDLKPETYACSRTNRRETNERATRFSAGRSAEATQYNPA